MVIKARIMNFKSELADYFVTLEKVGKREGCRSYCRNWKTF